jgi:hypothetical protein
MGNPPKPLAGLGEQERLVNKHTIRVGRMLLVGALFGCGTQGQQSEEPLARTTLAAITPPPAVPILPPTNTLLSVPLPSGKAVSDVALVGTDAVVLHDRSRILRVLPNTFATVFSNGTSGITHGVDGVSGDQWSRGNVVLRGPNTANLFNVRGDVTSGGTITLENNARISGQQHPQTAFSTHTFEFPLNMPSAFPAGQNFGPDDMSARLTPGSYGDVPVFSRSKLTLAAGEYTFKSLKLEPQTELVLENGNAPVFLYVKDELRYHGKISEQASGELVGNFLVGYFGTNTMTLEKPFIGTLIAPSATIELSTVTSPPGHQGAFFGKRVEVRPDVVVTHRPFPSFLIGKVDVSTTTPCANEPVKVDVSVVRPPVAGSSAAPLLVSIDGRPAVLEGGIATWHTQTSGVGSRRITVTVSQGGVAETRSIDIEIRSCATKFPRVVTTGTTTPYEVEFTLTNPADLPGADRTFHWTFGDGTSAQTTTPHVRHSYADRLDRRTPELKFEAELRIVRSGQPDASVKKTVIVPNIYAYGAARGFVQPLIKSNGQLAYDGATLIGEFSLRNLEPTPLTFTSRVVQRHFCDADRAPVNAAPESLSLSVAGASLHTEPVRLSRKDVRADVCGISVFLLGKTSDNLTAIASAHFATPARPLLTHPVTDGSVRQFLNDVSGSGMVANPDRITQEELEVLKSQGRISHVPRLTDQMDGVLQSSDDLLGQPCNPDETPPDSTVTCQATEDWEVTPPLIRNALKGDLIIVSACETIGGLLRSVEPRQYYSHEGIFTQNYYALAESTTSEGRILSSVEGLDGRLDGNKLKYGWPGGLRQTVTTAFSELHAADPEGHIQVLRTFRPEAFRCAGDDLPSPVLVIRPPIETPEVRSRLHAAADFALTSETHYRFFGYTYSNIAFDGDRNIDGRDYKTPFGEPEPATVSTSFLWHALRSNDVPLEGNEFEDLLRGFFHTPDGSPEENDERRLGAEAVPEGTLGDNDGLYLYTEAERRLGARYIYDQTYDGVARVQDKGAYDTLGWSADVTLPMLMLLTGGDPAAKRSQRERIASQFTNCFGFDMCGAPGEPLCPCSFNENQEYVCPSTMTAQEQAACNPKYVLDNPGIGVAVSPDNFLFWDTPHYGYWDYASYASGVFRRVHQWAPAAGSGACGGTVVFEDGSTVEGARVVLQGSTTSTDDKGQFHFDAAQAGQFDILADIEHEGVRHWDTALVDIPADGECDPVELVLTVDGPYDDMKPVEVTERRVLVRGNLHLHDDENGSDENADFPIDTECVVSPVNRQVVLNSQALTGNNRPCAGGEVSATLSVTCLLDPTDLTNQRVIITSALNFTEASACDGSGNIFDDPEHDSAGFGPAPLDADATLNAELRTSVEGGDRGALDLEFINGTGNTIVINPIKEEHRRRVVFEGNIEIHDDDFGDPSETVGYEFQNVCHVDPLDPEDEVHWSECVDNEVRAELDITCRLLAADGTKVTVSTEARLFEESTCLNTDRDGIQSRFTPPLEPCDSDDACPTVFLNSPSDGEALVVHNDDEGGDKATFTITMRNRRQNQP